MRSHFFSATHRTTPTKDIDRFRPHSQAQGSAMGVVYNAPYGLDILVSIGVSLPGEQPVLAIQDFSSNSENSLVFWAAHFLRLTRDRTYFRSIITHYGALHDLSINDFMKLHDDDKHFFVPGHEVYLVKDPIAIKRFFDLLEHTMHISLVPLHQSFKSELSTPRPL